MSNVFNIPAGIPFAKTLAQYVLDTYTNLSQVTILLPTRRACRVMHEAFLQISGGKPLILPRLQTLGDIDEEELALNIAGEEGLEQLLDLPPAMSALKRQFLLARLISSVEGFSQGFDHALKLAKALGQFMDQIYTENLDIRDLDKIVPEEFATHWQITLEFLKILSQSWPDILAEKGEIDAADRRNRLILALSKYWQSAPPDKPIIAAGTTGSIPAVAELLKTIAKLPKGYVVLPGLDPHIDQKSWDAASETHPQYGFKLLLEHMNVPREDVQLLPNCLDNENSAARRALAAEIMRPSETSSEWTNLTTNKKAQSTYEKALENCSLFETADEREEAEIIAILMREVLEKPGATAALITPDRNLARRASAAATRWGITLDDSGGQNLAQSRAGTFFLQALTCINERLAPVSLLALLKHQLCTHFKFKDVQALETQILRGPKPKLGFAGLYERLEGVKEPDDDTAIAREALEKLQSASAPLTAYADGFHDAQTIIKAHIEFAQTLNDPEKLWTGEDGEALSKLLSEVLEQTEYMPPLSLETYYAMLETLMRGVTIRPLYGTHPRLSILGQIEARMLDADLVIMAGLNENTWPTDPGHDPWLSRPMRKDFGLPVYERSVGLAAHDFVQAFCSPKVVLTRAARSSGAPTIPTRWLQRLETVLKAAKLDKDQISDKPQKYWAAQIDHVENITPSPRPEPRPPAHVRPNQLSATAIETWMKDPYSVYARYVLKLRPLDPLEQEADAAQRGEILHEVLQRFIKAHPKDLPQNSADILYEYAQDATKKHHDNPDIWRFWWPRFERLSHWFIEEETNRRATGNHPLITEQTGRCDIEGFTITARADRIDQGVNGPIAIDYKSGGSYSASAMRTGASPQLPIESLIIAEGGFAGITAKPCESLEYWILTGSATLPGKITAERKEIEELNAHTRAGLIGLIHAFADENTPYYSLPREGFEPRFSDYKHLARIKEWANLDGEEAA